MKLANLKLNPDNPRNIKPEKLEKLAQSIKDFPKMMVKRPIVYDENKIIIGGNMRYKAIEKLGMTEIPDEWTSDASDFTPEERKRFIMQDNAEMGEHDWDMVANQYELEDLDAWGIDVPYADTAEEVEEDEAPEVSSEPPVSQLGVVYQLGRHRVMCGDSLKDADKLFDTATIAFTSPPYNAKRRPMLSERKNGNKADVNKYETYDDDNEDYYELLEAFNTKALEKCKYSFVNLQLLAGNKKQVLAWLYSNTDRLVDIAFWKKNQVAPAMAENVMNSQVELIIILGGNGSRAVSTANFRGNVSNFVETDNASRENENSDKHNATFPVSFVSHFISNFTQKGDSVYDAFIGTGTTLIACEQTDRTCYGMELDPKYVDVIRKRYAKFTASDGQLPENWEELTPAIERELSENNG